MLRLIGIDPGSKGAIAVIDEGVAPVFYDLDKEIGTYSRYLQLLSSEDDIVVTVEDVCGRPGQSCVANTTFMKLAGMAELMGWSISNKGFFKVKPQVWKRHFDLISHGLSKTERKHLSVDLVNRLYTGLNIPYSKDGRAEALLIGLYGKSIYEEENMGDRSRK